MKIEAAEITAAVVLSETWSPHLRLPYVQSNYMGQMETNFCGQRASLDSNPCTLS